MVGDAGEHFAHVALRIEAVQFRCADQAVEGGGALTARIGTCKKVVLASQSDGAFGNFFWPISGGLIWPTLGRCSLGKAFA